MVCDCLVLCCCAWFSCGFVGFCVIAVFRVADACGGLGVVDCL